MKAWNSFVLGLGYVYLLLLVRCVAMFLAGSWETIRWRRTVAKAQRQAFLKEMERHEEVSALDHLYRVK